MLGVYGRVEPSQAQGPPTKFLPKLLLKNASVEGHSQRVAGATEVQDVRHVCYGAPEICACPVCELEPAELQLRVWDNGPWIVAVGELEMPQARGLRAWARA